ncbi:unnamed protein product, partial [Symbiodinium sp. KB8]
VSEEPMPLAQAEVVEEAAQEAPAVTVAEEARACVDAVAELKEMRLEDPKEDADGSTIEPKEEAHDIVLPMVQVTASEPPSSFCACGSLW